MPGMKLPLKGGQDGATPVLFRMFKGEVVAVFPCDPADATGAMLGCIARADNLRAYPRKWLEKTTPATPKAAESLRQDIEARGHRLRVCLKITPDQDEVRRCRTINGEIPSAFNKGG